MKNLIESILGIFTSKKCLKVYFNGKEKDMNIKNKVDFSVKIDRTGCLDYQDGTNEVSRPED